MSKTMILAVGGAGCNIAETIMRVANAHWVKEATYLFADSIVLPDFRQGVKLQ